MARRPPEGKPAAGPRAHPAPPARAPAGRRCARDSQRPSRRPHSRLRETSRTLSAQLVELLPRTRVDDVVFCEPAAPRLPDPQLDVVLRSDLVRIGVDEEL